jgi:Sec7 domain/Mon2/Sec7/BIG1-like, HUS domain/FYVE zinc finger
MSKEIIEATRAIAKSLRESRHTSPYLEHLYHHTKNLYTWAINYGDKDHQSSGDSIYHFASDIFPESSTATTTTTTSATHTTSTSRATTPKVEFRTLSTIPDDATSVTSEVTTATPFGTTPSIADTSIAADDFGTSSPAATPSSEVSDFLRTTESDADFSAAIAASATSSVTSTGGASGAGAAAATLNVNSVNSTMLSPIIDVKVLFTSREKPPPGYTVVKESVGGQKADLNRGTGARDIYLCYLRADAAHEAKLSSAEQLKPITSISVIFKDTFEEPPYGFEVVQKTATNAYDANLNSGTAGHWIYLAVHRDCGPPITDIGVLIADRKETLPAGYHQVIHTPFGHLADLNSGSDGTPIFVCFRTAPQPILHVLETLEHQDSDTNALPARFLACLSMIMYSANQRLVLKALEAFKKLSTGAIPTALKLEFLRTTCDSVDVLLSYFTTKGYRILLRFFLSIMTAHWDVLTPDVCLQMFETCFLLRHEDKIDKISHYMLELAVRNVQACMPVRCACASGSVYHVRRSTSAATAISDMGTPDRASRNLHPRNPSSPDSLNNSEDIDDFDARSDISRLSGDTEFADICRKCAFSNMMQRSDSSTYCSTMVSAMSDNVVLTGVINDALSRFQRHTRVNKAFRTDIVNDLSRMFSDRAECILVGMTLVCAKFAAEPADFNLKKSEKVKRKGHALMQLYHVLKVSGPFFNGGSTVPAPGVPLTPQEIVLRRFICSSLVSCCVTDMLEYFRMLLQIFVLLWTRFRHLLMMELRVFLDYIFLGLLQMPLCSSDQKRDIIDALIRMFSDPDSVIYLFYNYDNDHRRMKVYENLINVLDQLVEGDLKKQPGASGDDPGEDALRRRAVKLMVNVLYMLAIWTGVPGLQHGRRSSSMLRSAYTDVDDEKGDARGAGSVPATWKMRFDGHKEDAKIMEEALKLARQESVKSSLKYLRTIHAEQSLPRVFANFLYRHSELDKKQVGEILGGGKDNLMSEAQHRELRHLYLGHFSFISLSTDAALRMFLTNSGFRLPGEAQKIDRLLSAFAEAYCRDNPDAFRSVDSCYIVIFALVMLNTDIHDPRLSSGGSSRKAMTMDQFKLNLRGTDEGHDFPDAFLTQLYNGIARHPIEWKAETPDQADDAASVPLEVQARETMEHLCLRALAQMKLDAPLQRTYYSTDSVHIVFGIFEVSWFRYLSAMATLIEHTRDVSVLQVCLDGLAYGACIAIVMGLDTERKAFIRWLAKIAFIANHKGTKNELQERLAANDHLKQQWYRPLNLQMIKHPVGACHTIRTMVAETKQVIAYQRQQEDLRKLQDDFGNDIMLENKDRHFVKQDLLTKVARDKRHLDYHFFLFSDILIYASDGMHARYSVHRTLQLSLMRLEDVKTERAALHILSPQKNAYVLFRDEKQKAEWMGLLIKQIGIVRAKRDEYVRTMPSSARLNVVRKHSRVSSADAFTPARPSSSRTLSQPNIVGASNNRPSSSRTLTTPATPQSDSKGRQSPAITSADEQETDGAASDSDFIRTGVPQFSAADLTDDSDTDSGDIRRRYSTFVGASELSIATAGKGSGREKFCKLCIRPFTSVMRRRNMCNYCNEMVCSDCCERRALIPNTTRRQCRVCDACYGVLKGDVGANVPIVIESNSDKNKSNSNRSSPSK